MNQEDKHIIDDLEVAPIQMPSDSYFEALKKSVLQEIGNDGLNKKDETRIISLYKRWYVWGSAAAILAFIFLVSRNSTHSTDQPGGQINLSSVSNEEIYQYLDENIEDLDAETIAVHLSKDAMAGSELYTTNGNQSGAQDTETFTSGSSLLEDVKDEEILDYLKNDPDTYRDGELDEYLLIES
jgi:hypothetical protein